MRVVVASLAVAAPLSLWGCGGDDTTAAPGGGGGGGGDGTYNPTTVKLAWDNHFGAFAEFDVPRIMKDYDDTSEITVFNDACMPDARNDQATAPAYATPKGMTRYVGTTAIKGFFESLFEQLNTTLSNVNNIGPRALAADKPINDEQNGEPVVLEPEGNIANANVFLTWRTVDTLDKPLKSATDTFSWRQINGRFWIDHQTIVVTDEGNAGTDGADCSTTARRAVPADGNKMKEAWDNHFLAFDNRSTVDYEGEFGMMRDYDANSIVAVWDNTGNKYTEYKTEAAIKGFFDDLFETMRAASSSGDKEGEMLRVGLLEIDESFNSVFLVWSSRSHVRATDTFIFTAEGKIARQNIVVTTMAPLLQSVAMVV